MLQVFSPAHFGCQSVNFFYVLSSLLLYAQYYSWWCAIEMKIKFHIQFPEIIVFSSMIIIIYPFFGGSLLYDQK